MHHIGLQRHLDQIDQCNLSGLRSSTHSLEMDAGEVVAALLQHPDTYNRKRVQFSSAYDHPLSQWISDLSEVTGQPAKYKTIARTPDDQKPSRSFEVAELEEHFDWVHEYGYYGNDADAAIVDASEVLGKPLMSWVQWLQQSEWAKQFIA